MMCIIEKNVIFKKVFSVCLAGQIRRSMAFTIAAKCLNVKKNHYMSNDLSLLNLRFEPKLPSCETSAFSTEKKRTEQKNSKKTKMM